MFVLRGRDGQMLTSSAWDQTNGEEICHETYEEAKQALKEIEMSMPKGMFRIEATKCERCGNGDDVTIIHVNDEPKAYCQNCRVEMFTKKKPVGRPSFGITKKVSLTLSEEEWKWFDEQAKGNRSQFLRHLVWEKQSPESEWDNYACLGYAILGAKKMEMNNEEINKLISLIRSEFDWKSVDQANEVYIKSEY